MEMTVFARLEVENKKQTPSHIFKPGFPGHGFFPLEKRTLTYFKGVKEVYSALHNANEAINPKAGIIFLFPAQ